MGISATHFDFPVKEKGFKVHFHTACQPKLDLPEYMKYIFSWIRK